MYVVICVFDEMWAYYPLVKMCDILSIAWSRCRDKQRKETSRLSNLNEKLSAMNRVLVEENQSLSKQAIHLVLQNQQIRKQLTGLRGEEVNMKAIDQVFSPLPRIYTYTSTCNIHIHILSTPKNLYIYMYM